MAIIVVIIIIVVIVAAVAGGGKKKEQVVTHGTSTPKTVATLMPSAAGQTAAGTPTAMSPSPTPKGPQFTTFGSGTKVVGTDIAAGSYRTRSASSGCYWARLNGFGGTLDEIIANENTDGPEIVTIAAIDKGFESERCDEWTSDLSAITSSPAASFGEGTFAVGVDIAPGTWRADGGSDCYWARLTGFGGTLDEVIANNNGTLIVTIGASDVGFTNSRCGTWTKVG